VPDFQRTVIGREAERPSRRAPHRLAHRHRPDTEAAAADVVEEAIVE
jgi:hypothetical protein